LQQLIICATIAENDDNLIFSAPIGSFDLLYRKLVMEGYNWCQVTNLNILIHFKDTYYALFGEECGNYF